jgi:S-adenosylmethionine:tRNA ribosyltransferase-isomerase
MINLDDYSYNLPAGLIAQRPASPRDSAKLLVYSLRTRQIHDDYFYNLPKYLDSSTSLVLSKTKVKKARLKFGPLEVFILEELNKFTTWVLVFPGRKFKLNKVVDLAPGISAEVLDINNSGHRKLKFNKKLTNPIFDQFKQTPLPPYIHPNESLDQDYLEDQYQTIFAGDKEESLAAPTAGLHFTSQLLNKIELNHQILEVDLTVGLGTFANIDSSNLDTGRLHQEDFEISPKVLSKLKSASHITAVGTTSVRALESSGPDFKNPTGSTDIFIYPGYKFHHVDNLITNFHLPGTSLLLLVTALLADKLNLSEPEARAELFKIYNHAIESGYHFFSFGDAMIITSK